MNGAPTFDEFVVAVHGREPFPWQRAMAEMLVSGGPPQLVTVPTGLGKTSVLDAWVWALAIQAEQRSARTVTTRAAFVVDRRVIVDAAFEHASTIQKALVERGLPAAAWVAERLRGLGHDLGQPIDVVRMRGGVTWAWRWLRQPDQPAVIVGTVDQFGSRFLFRGYGVGARLRPIDAALVGNDVTVFVDEAHLSTALVHTVRTSADLEARSAVQTSARRTSIVAMSATPPINVPGDASVLTIGQDDLNNEVAARRLTAVKAAEFVDLPPSKQSNAAETLAKELASRAVALAAEGRVVAVVVNTIDVARMVHSLASAPSKNRPAVDAVLAIGRCRNLDREASRRIWWDRAAAGRQRARDTRGLVVVATQTIEVGADLDVDCLLTEIAPIDSLVQRFGRVDRLGSLGSTTSWIVRQPKRSEAKSNHVYGEAADRTWDWLKLQAGPGVIDFGPEAMGARLRALSDSDRRALVAPVAAIPELFNEVLHQLARTNPSPNPDHPIATYLHGMCESQPAVGVVWRAGIGGGAGTQVLRANPPTTAEAVEVPLTHAMRFLRGDDAGATASDLDSVVSPEAPPDDEPESGQTSAPIEVWLMREGEPRHLVRPSDLRPGDLIVVDSEVGGHDQFGWTGRADHRVVPDIADLVRSGPPQLRVDPAVVSSVLGERSRGESEPPSEVEGLCAALQRTALDELSGKEWERTPAERRARALQRSRDLDALVDSLLSAVCRDAQGRPLEAEILSFAARFPRTGWTVATGEPGGGRNNRATVVVDGFSVGDEGVATCLGIRLCVPSQWLPLDRVDDSARGSSQVGVAVGLDAHLGAVSDRAAQYAANVGLSRALVESVRIAGLAHDLGKADPRFQAMLRGGDWLAVAAFDGDPGEALAKSARGAPRSAEAVDPQWEWPRGMRHEAISVALVREASLPDGLDEELIEHLVAAHHGWSRPLFPPVTDAVPRPVVARFEGQKVRAASDDVLVDWTQPARFRRLCERYGWWGLALLESVLRLADMAVSEEGS